jgi:hypothetical protein
MADKYKVFGGNQKMQIKITTSSFQKFDSTFLQGLPFARQVLYHLNQNPPHTQALFALGVFHIGSCFIPGSACTAIPLIYAACVPGITEALHHVRG